MTDIVPIFRQDLLYSRQAILCELTGNDFYTALSCWSNLQEKLDPNIQLVARDASEDKKEIDYKASLLKLSQSVNQHLFNNAFYTASQLISKLKPYEQSGAKTTFLKQREQTPIRDFNSLSRLSAERVQLSIKELQHQTIHFAFEVASPQSDASTVDHAHNSQDHSPETRFCVLDSHSSSWKKWHPSPYLPTYAPCKTKPIYRQIYDHRPLRSLSSRQGLIVKAVPIKKSSKWPRSPLPRQKMIPRPIQPVKR